MGGDILEKRCHRDIASIAAMTFALHPSNVQNAAQSIIVEHEGPTRKIVWHLKGKIGRRV
jgi:hypothetical protein